jgi:ATP-dependent Lhr-like helicase
MIPGLHPKLAAWFAARFRQPTDVQRQAVPFCLEGRNVLILSPTGTGKTLAGFLSVLDLLGREAQSGRLDNHVRAVYVSPLRALTLDIRRNLTPPLEALNAELPPERRIRLEVRTGDTELNERTRMQRRRPHLLLTTPESLSSLLSQAGWGDGFAASVVLVDEIHAFAENKRGSLLALTLERLEARSPAPLQRIGMSATAWPERAVAELFCGSRTCQTVASDVRRAYQLTVACPEDEVRLPVAGYSPSRTAPLAARLIQAARCSLVFTSTRSAAERLGLALKVLLPDWEEHIEVHHGSIAREDRLGIEQRLTRGELKAVVCSTSLEMGVDFDAVDQVLLIGTPRGVSRALQRLGRAGHRVDGVAAGHLVPLSLPDLLECAAVCAAVRAGRLDKLRVPQAPLDVLAQVMLGMAVERRWQVEEAWRLVRQAGPYRDLPRKDFDAVLEYLAGGGKVLGPYGTYGKIILHGGAFEAGSRRVARDYYHNIGAISDDLQMKVVAGNRRALGSVEESFLASLMPGEGFVIGGRSVRVKMIHQDTALVEPATGERVQTPRWMGGKMQLSARLAEEELRLRRALREAWTKGGRGKVISVLSGDWHLPEPAAKRIADYVTVQYQAAPVPVDIPVQLERIPHGRRGLLLLFHSVAGRDVNRSLAWVVGHRFARAQTDAPGVAANFNDHAFALSIDARLAPCIETLRLWFEPAEWEEDLLAALASTETLGRRFRAVAEVGQLLPRRKLHGPVSPKASAWSASLLYSTLRKYEPDHPLLKEAVRESIQDQLDAQRAAEVARRIFESPWEVFDLPRPSPFAIPLFASFQREILLTPDPDRALEDAVEELYSEWGNGVDE